MDTKDIERCEAELIEQGYSRDDAKQECANREGSEERDYFGVFGDECEC